MNRDPQRPSDGARPREDQPTSAMVDRSNYKDVWDRQAADVSTAKQAVAGYEDEHLLEETAELTVRTLDETVGIGRHDVVLEIGCGIARVGKQLSRRCLHWFGADISGRMLQHAARRLEGVSNTTLVELSTVGLPEFPDAVFDVVYCTVVFMHLYEWDRYRYVQEAHRVLRPGGRCYFDNVSIDSEHGWAVFSAAARYPLERRPAHMSMVSTRDELRTYLQRAAFEDVRGHDLINGWIAATGRKSSALPP